MLFLLVFLILNVDEMFLWQIVNPQSIRV